MKDARILNGDLNDYNAWAEIGIKLQQQDTMKLVMKQEKQKSY